MGKREGLWLWPIGAFVRLRGALHAHWRRIVAGAAVGWFFAVVGGAFALASLEFHGLVSEATSDELGIVIVIYGVGAGALFSYVIRPGAVPQSDAGSHQLRE